VPRHCQCALLLLALGLLACSQPPGRSEQCTPTFRQLSSTPIDAEAGSFQIRFSVALIGCKERLGALTEREVELIEREFTEPSHWSTHEIDTGRLRAEFRNRAVGRLNTILGRDAITDVFISSVNRKDRQ